MTAELLHSLFNQYLTSFKCYDLDGVVSCYHLPCTLNTPDKLSLLTNEQDCKNEINAIFSQLKNANINEIIVKSASYQIMSSELILVNVDWDFIDDNKQMFADFTAVYHVLMTEFGLKIINVNSHELSNSLTLQHSLSL
jgi:hypothetical protein